MCDALTRVEAAGPDDSGLLAFGDEPAAGGILVERGRICWAAAPGMQRRLKDLLATSVAGVDLDAVFQRCRREGRLLGQTLLDEGWITASALETALRRHSAESLIELCNADNDNVLPTWTSRGTVGYSPRFTFRPLDVLLDVAALAEPELHAIGRRELANVAGPGRRAGAFFVDVEFPEDVDVDVAIPIAAAGETTIHDLWQLGQWAIGIPRATRELGVTPTFVLAATASGTAAVVWWRQPLVYAVICDDRPAISAMIAYHARGGDGS